MGVKWKGSGTSSSWSAANKVMMPAIEGDVKTMLILAKNGSFTPPMYILTKAKTSNQIHCRTKELSTVSE